MGLREPRAHRDGEVHPPGPAQHVEARPVRLPEEGVQDLETGGSWGRVGSGLHGVVDAVDGECQVGQGELGRSAGW